MNDIIKTFEAQCTDTVEIYNDVTGITHEREFFDKERFAELIVAECCQVLSKETIRHDGYGYNQHALYQKIREHFGVEE